MSPSGSTHTGAFADAHVDEMLGHGATLAQVEKFIERQPLSEEDRSVLWLRAWTTFDGEADTDASRARATHPGVLAVVRRTVRVRNRPWWGRSSTINWAEVARRMLNR